MVVTMAGRHAVGPERPWKLHRHSVEVGVADFTLAGHRSLYRFDFAGHLEIQLPCFRGGVEAKLIHRAMTNSAKVGGSTKNPFHTVSRPC